jgi:membrane fusion protein, multidrug efflux system
MNMSHSLASHRSLPALALAAVLSFAPAGCKRAPVAAPAPVPEVVVTTVVQRDVPVYSEWVGTTVGFVNADIYPKISGYLLKQNYKDGGVIKAGQLLFQIDPREYQAALDQALGDLAQKKADNKKNQQDLGRYTPLYQQQIISREEFDHADQAARASAASVKAAEGVVESARLNLEWCQVTSPIDGIAGIAKAQVGNLVSPTTLLTSVSQLDPIKVTFPISEREYLHYADRIKIHAVEGHLPPDSPQLQMILADGSTYKYPGHFYATNRQVNIQTGTVKVQGLFPNPDLLLRPGLYAKIRTPADTLHGALLVPESAVLETQGQYQVAVVGADNRVTMHPVTLGKRAQGQRIIQSGVAAGDHVIVEGVQKVSDGMQVAPKLEPPPPASSGTPASGADAVNSSPPATPAPHS